MHTTNGDKAIWVQNLALLLKKSSFQGSNSRLQEAFPPLPIMVYFSKTPSNMLDCMIKRYNGAAQPTEEHGAKKDG